MAVAGERRTARGAVGGVAQRRDVLITIGLSLGLFAVALLARWWGLAGQSRAMYGDEAQLMVASRAFIQGSATTPFSVDALTLPALYDYLLSFPLRWAGSMDVTVARGFSGVLGALSVPLLYLTACELGYPRRVGVLAGVALATTFWDVHFSRLVLQNIMAASASSVVVLCTVLAVRRANLVWAALAGVALAWAFNAYLSGIMVAPLIGAWLAALALGYSRWWRRPHLVPPAYDKGSTGHENDTPLDLNSVRTRPRVPTIAAVSAVLCGVALLCAWPLLSLYLAPGSTLSAHMSARYIFTPAYRATFAAAHPTVGSGTWNMLWYQITTTAGMFLGRGEVDPVFNLPGRPMLDPLSGVLFWLGVAGALWWWRRPSAALVLLWMAVPLFMGTTLTTGTTLLTPAPASTRALPALPAICLLIALGLEVIFELAGGAGRWAARGRRTAASSCWPALRLGVAVPVMALVGVLGISRYVSFVDAPVYGQVYYNSAHEWSIFIARRGAIPVTVIGPSGWAGEFVTLFAPRARLCTGRWDTTWNACPPARIIIFDHDQTDARHYAALTHRSVHAGPSDDAITRFWYVEGQNLPDPKRVLRGTA